MQTRPMMLGVALAALACSSKPEPGPESGPEAMPEAKAKAPAEEPARETGAPAAAPADAAPAAADEPPDLALSFDPKAAPLDRVLERRVRAIRVLDLLTGSAAERLKRGKQRLVDYVREQAVADSDHGKLQLRPVDCQTHADHRCVAVIGDPCAVGVPADSDCEGFYLTVVVDLSSDRPALDRALAGGGPVKSLDDIVAQRAEAP